MSTTTDEDIVMHGALHLDSPQFGVMDPLSEESHPQEYYEAIKKRYCHTWPFHRPDPGRTACYPRAGS